MPTVIYIGLHPETMALISEAVSSESLTFEEEATIDFKETCKKLQQYEAILIGEEVANPIRFAQDIFAHDKNISILLINDAENYPKIKQALQFSPFIGPTVQCISNELGKRIAPILEDNVQRTAQRRSFARVKTNSLSDTRFLPNAFEKVRSDFASKVLQKAPIGAILISGEGLIFSINNYALQSFNRSEKEVLGSLFSSLFPELVQFSISSFLQDGYITETKRVFEVQEAAESIKYFELSVAPISLEATANYKLVLLNNITAAVEAQQSTQAHLDELKKLNTNLERVNADLDTFVYTASHDLKSPILNIEGLVTLLELELGPARAIVELELQHIKRSISRFKQTVENLTEVARVQKSFEKETSLVVLADIVDEVRQLLEREIIESDAQIELVDQDAPTARLHKKNLTSIIYNLVNNGIKYRCASRRPFILIKTWRENDNFWMSVQDNGLGIPVSKRQRVFQLFKRMHSHVEGSGVGLYIVKRIVENNGGDISIESEEGAGTLFKVNLKEVTV